jgi:hypothetical protein
MIPARRNRHPEADVQRAIVAMLRAVLPKRSVVHHSPNEAGGGPSAAKRQAILVGMGVHPGWSDLTVLSEGRVLFLEVKSATGRLSAAEAEFRDTVDAMGFPWALVRSVDDALLALQFFNFKTRIRRP